MTTISFAKKIAVGAIIGTFVFGVALGTLLLVAYYQSWTPVYWVVAAFLGPLLVYAFYADFGSTGGLFKAFLRFVLRLYWQHIVLAAYLWGAAVIAVMMIFSTLEGAAKRAARTDAPVFFREGRLPQSETEKFFAFANSVSAPVQWAWGWLLTLWQVFVFLAVLFFEQVSKWVTSHPVISATVVVALYVWWLIVTVRKLWRDEFPRRSLAADGPAYSPATASTGYWLK